MAKYIKCWKVVINTIEKHRNVRDQGSDASKAIPFDRVASE